MLVTTIASITLSLAAQTGALAKFCPVSGEQLTGPGTALEYNGARFETCCGGCVGGFEKNPAAVLAAPKLKGKTVGVFMFDPVAGTRIEAKKAKAGPSVHNGIAFYFASEKNQKAFEAEPKRYAAMPEKEALYCPVMGHAVAGYAEAGAYADVEGVRYYLCCPDCLGSLKADPAKHVGKAASHIKVPAAHKAKVKVVQSGAKDECCAGGDCKDNCCAKGTDK